MAERRFLQHEERNFVSPSSHVMSYLLHKQQWNTKPFHFNPLSPNRDQHQFSPKDIHRLSRPMVMRINKMINKEKMPWSLIKFSQLILKGNVWRSVWRICMWILGLKGLIAFCCERHDLLCSHSNSDLFTYEDNMLFPQKRYCVFVRKLTWYFIGVSIIK